MCEVFLSVEHVLLTVSVNNELPVSLDVRCVPECRACPAYCAVARTPPGGTEM